MICCHTDVVETFETYMSHLPKWDESDLSRPHPFFLCPIDGNLKEPGVWYHWYAKARVGLKQVAKWLKEMVTALSSVEGANYSNKSARVTTIGRFNAMGVPPEIGMRMIGYTSREGYMRYDKDSQDIMMHALQNVASVVSGTEGNISWEAALNYEKDHYKELQKSASKSYIASSSNSHILPSLTSRDELQSKLPHVASITTQEVERVSTSPPFADRTLLLHGNRHMSIPNSELTDDEFWSSDTVEHIKEFYEISKFMEQIGALLPTQPQVSNVTHTIGNTIFNGNLSNCTIQLTVPDASTVASLLAGVMTSPVSKEDRPNLK